MKPLYYSRLLPEMLTRSKYATVSRLGLSNPALRTHLLKSYSAGCGEPGSFLADPVFEATFGWEAAAETMEGLAGSLLSPALVSAMDAPPAALRDEYRFPKTAHPYRHQLQCWKVLSSAAPQSVIVTSGTGSGKTECFMVPILDSLARKRDAAGTPLTGVRALFLYPLNALINSQRDRLQAWTHAFGAGIRFCLYNGNTPNLLPARDHEQTPAEVLDRAQLRASPPPVLVTNATMLEYMLVRAQDAPILEKSKGLLEWIVLDEAHSYIGSQAAELALLLRRVLYGFGVEASRVRFVATSATIGDPSGEAGSRLRAFLADLAGVDIAQVHVIGGKRAVPVLPSGQAAHRSLSLEQLRRHAEEDPEHLYETLAGNDTALRLRTRFAAPPDAKPVAKLSELKTLIPGGSDAGAPAQQKTLEWLDLLTSARRRLPSGGIEPFLPLRSHIFHQVMAGLWACADPDCAQRAGTLLDSPAWAFGKVFFEKRGRCECGAPVFEIRSCNECNESFLSALLVHREGGVFLESEGDLVADEFSLDVEHATDDGLRADETDESGEDMQSEDAGSQRVIIAPRKMTPGGPARVELQTLQVNPPGETACLELGLHDASATISGTLQCPACGTADSPAAPLLRSPILGAPFLLGQIIPTLLEFCEDGEKPLEKPYRGRRMITFTDSRQGTARIAAKIQQDSERNRVRGLVLARLARAKPPAGADAEQLRAQIAALKPLESTNPLIAEMVRSKEAELLGASAPKPVGFEDLADYLSTNEPDISRIHKYYETLDPALFSTAIGKREIAKMLLAREFARRPKRVNSSETMGLVAVTYPGLAAVVRAPAAGGMTVDEYKAFLKVTLDMHVRENTCIDLPECWMKWGGNKMGRKWLLGPRSTEAAGYGYKRWPQTTDGKRQNRLVRLLAKGLKLDVSSAAGRDTIETVLRAAWDDLRQCGVLSDSGSGGHYLSFSSMAFAPVTQAWVCPVTRRILDTTFRGITPYLPRDASPEKSLCTPVTLPACPLMNGDFASADERTNAIRDWLSSSAEITALREDGLWSDLCDRIVEGGAFFRTAEHSAQQPAARLATYEKAFKEGYLNLLSCSTTMEMGVDIGGIMMVAMNNVPPHPANYLQRAGRAGRRSETRSVALTVCKNNPHDQAVFDNTRWPFDTTLPMPSISLSSAAIVLRHLSSMLLAHFLRHRVPTTGVDLNKLDCGWFFLPAEDSLADQFCGWADNFLETDSQKLAVGLRSLTRSTCFESTVRLSALAAMTAAEMRRVQLEWLAEYSAVEERLKEFSTPALQGEPAARAMMIQRTRLMSEYLLSELASSGFLPGYGFPNHIASFDTLNLEQIEKEKNEKKEKKGHREDNRMRHRDLPSRDLVTALREYAPGADVVMDGLVYRAAGITLNWHSPASASGVREIQSIRLAWRCRSCGASGTAQNAGGTLHCTDCGRAVQPDCIRKYLEPAGFAVDLYAPVHNDISAQQFIRPQMPWIHVSAPWTLLPNPALGRFRTSADGSAIFQSSGTGEDGYAICLKCGRAVPMGSAAGDTAMANGHLPAVFRSPHRPLRGKQGGASAICEGSHESWSVMTNLHLGHEVRTDVLELQLMDREGRYLEDEAAAFSLAVAIRASIAAMMGVQDEELGCTTKEVRAEGGAVCRAILVFDNSASGYVTAVAARIADVLRGAHSQLLCSHHCDSACQHCLDSYGTRFQRELLNRHAALDFMSAAWIDELKLPDCAAFFGAADSAAEYLPLPEAIWRELTRPAATALHVYLHGDPDTWDLPSSSLRSLLNRWIGREKPVTFVLDPAALKVLSGENRRLLGAWGAVENVHVATCLSLPAAGGAQVLAHVISNAGVIGWASDDSDAGIPGPGWGAQTAQLLVRGNDTKDSLPALTLVPQQSLIVSENRADSYRFEISSQLNGNLQGFGTRFWEALFGAYPELERSFTATGKAISSMTYRDRYLRSPLPLALVLEVVGSLRKRCDAIWECGAISIETVPLGARFPGSPEPRFVWSDWTSENAREAAVREAFGYCGLACSGLAMAGKSDAEHARTLELSFSDGSGMTVRFDQGFSYWTANRQAGGPASRTVQNLFDFTATAEDQGVAIAEMRCEISNPNYDTFLYAHLSKLKN